MSTQHRADTVRADESAGMTGRFVRRRRDRAPHEYTPWAQVSMTVPSVDGPCWLVCYADGDVDVWRIDDDAARYQVRDAHSRPGTPS